jgi:GntR family transcriptional regulator
VFTLNPTSGIPIYRQLLEQIRRMVAGGQLRPGDTLPSVRDLALTHAVNPMTISKAYSLLEGEGVLERQRGKGMIVARAGPLKESKAERLRRLETSLATVATEAAQLELPAEDVIKALRKLLEQRT